MSGSEAPRRVDPAHRPDPRSPAETPIRVVIVDDHALYRRGLQVVLEMEPDIHVVGEAGDGEEAVEVVARERPDVVVLDVRMPRCGGIEACARISEAVPSARIVMLTTSDEEQDLVDSLKAGAVGYLLKDVPPEEVVDGIRAVQAGQSLLSPSLASTILTEFTAMLRGERPAGAGQVGAPAAAQAPEPTAPVPARGTPRVAGQEAPRLTERELEVLGHVARGLANKDIAAQLFISENTVKNHVRNILEKLHLHSRMEAALYAVRERLVDERRS